MDNLGLVFTPIIYMQFTDAELVTLNEYLNGESDLPVDVEAINVKLREHFSQDNSVVAPEVEAAVAEEVAIEAAPEEVVDAPVVDALAPEVAPEDAAPVSVAAYAVL